MKSKTARILFSAFLTLACAWASEGNAVFSTKIEAQTLPGGIVCGVGLGWTNRPSARIAAQALSQLDLAPADTLPEPALVDVMFLYTPLAVIGAGDEESIREKVFESVAHANYLFINSQVNVRINPVFIGRIDYAESGALDTDLARLATGQGSLSRAATLRNDYKADIVCLIVEVENMGASGYAYDIPPLRGNAAGAFLAIRRTQLGRGTIVLAHELGHLFGCHHDREHAGDLNAPWIKNYRNYIFGHRLQIEGVTYVDVMSYEPGIYLPYFANPRISLDGAPLGVPEGQARPSDPARTMNETAPYVAKYRTALSRIDFESAQYEITEKSGSIALQLRRSGNLNTSTRVTVSIGSGSTAKASTDYVRPETMTVSFATNQTDASFTIPIIADDSPEPSEDLRLSLTSPLGDHGIHWQGETLIIIHDAAPPIVGTTLHGADGNVLTAAKESAGTIEVSLGTIHSVQYATYPETLKWRLQAESARPGQDYVEATGHIAVRRVALPAPNGFPIYLLPDSFEITLLDDDKPEPDKVFRLIVEGASVQWEGETYAYSAVTNRIRIVDNDRLGAVTPMGGAAPTPEAGMNLAVRHDGKFLVWGGFTSARSLDRLAIALLRPDGAVDPSFQPPEFLAGHRKIEGLGSAQIATVEFLPEGKFLVAGQFSRVNGEARSQLVRLNADGSLDESFGQGLTFDGSIREIAAQPDGRIIVGGAFEKINGERHAFIARLKSDGSIDQTFQPNGGPTSEYTVFVFAIALQADGKILIGGFFQKVDGAQALNIARLHPDGRLDTSFKLQNVSGPVTRIALQSDGRIVLAGLFDTVGGRFSRKIARVNPDGSSDLTFRPPHPNNEVREVLPLPDGRLVVSGAFTTIANSNRRFIALLNPDGTLNEEFDPGAGPNELLGPLGSSSSRAMTVHANGSLYIAGRFETMNGLPASGIVRLKFGDPGSAITKARLNDSGEIVFGADVFPGGVYPIEATSDFVQWSEIGSLSTEGYAREATKTLPRNAEHRFFRLRNPSH